MSVVVAVVTAVVDGLHPTAVVVLNNTCTMGYLEIEKCAPGNDTTREFELTGRGLRVITPGVCKYKEWELRNRAVTELHIIMITLHK